VDDFDGKPLAVRIKSYGEQKVWLMDVI
jgi:hypothetical protein